MYENGVEPKEICRRMGFSRQRFFQIMDMLEFRYGVELPEFGGEVTYACSQAANLLQVSGPQWVMARLHLLEDADMLKTGLGYLRIRYSGVRKLEEMAQATVKCEQCGKDFKPKQRRSKFCTHDCRYEYTLRLRRQQPGARFSGSGEGTYLEDVRAAVASVPDPPPGEWLTLYGICKTGCRLSMMQLGWLKIRGILPTKLSEDRKWRGAPCELVNTTHVLAAEQVFADHGRLRK